MGMRPLFQELDKGDPIAFSAAGWLQEKDGRVTMRHVVNWSATNCDALPFALNDIERAACWTNVGLLLTTNMTAAADAYIRATSVNANDAAAHFNFALVLQKLGRFQEADASFEAATKLEPREAVVTRAHGRMHDDLGAIAEAERIYRAAVKRGIWRHWKQRAPHVVRTPKLATRAWHWPFNGNDRTARVVGAWANALEANFVKIREEALAVSSVHTGWAKDAESLVAPQEQCAAGARSSNWTKFIFCTEPLNAPSSLLHLLVAYVASDTMYDCTA
jgi:tetratricopeptide (TPR) repeat protein